MVMYIVGIGNLLAGLAYCGMGLLSAWEAASQYQQRGLSRFGLAFSLMAASCGPHHLVHGWCVLQGTPVAEPSMVVALTGLPAGLIFVMLRLEAMLNGRGDRTLRLASPWVVGVGIVWLMLVGGLAVWAVAAPPGPGQDVCSVARLLPAWAMPEAGPWGLSLVLLANVFVTVTYAMVGWYLMATQIRRYAITRQWSLSGLALAAIFPTCAAMHLVMGLSSAPDSATLPFDLLGVPASVYFLWVVRQLHMDSAVDWNQRPLVGVTAQPSRPAPWSDARASS